MARKSKSSFTMKGSPMKRNFGIKVNSPMKETIMPTRTGAVIDPTLSYKYKSAKIPSFRDMVSLEQQQAARKAWKAKRAGRKEEKEEWEKKKEAGAYTLDKEDIDLEKKEVPELTVDDPNEGEDLNINTSNSLW